MDRRRHGFALHPLCKPSASSVGGGIEAYERRANIYSRTLRSGAGAGPESQMKTIVNFLNGGRDRDRTCDPYHVKVVLFR
jgi:hypothetical protein